MDENFKNSLYDVTPIQIRVGQENPVLNFLLQCNQKTEWIYITAWNPNGEQASNGQNKRQNGELLEELQKRDWVILPGFGIGDARDWPPEASFLVLGCSKEEGRLLAKRFEQKAFLYGSERDKPSLVYMERI